MRGALHISAPRRRALLKTIATAPEEAGEAFAHQILSPQRPCHDLGFRWKQTEMLRTPISQASVRAIARAAKFLARPYP